MNHVLRYNKNVHQKEFQEDVLTKFLHLSSGFGGGKSYALAMKAFQLSFLNKGIRGGCVVPSIADYKKDLLPIIQDILSQNQIKYRYHQSDKWFLFPWSRGKMYVASAEKSLRGPNWGWAIINEAGLIKHERYKEAIGRVRVKNSPYPQIASSGTPEGVSSYVHEVFIEQPMRNSRIIFGDTRDNQENLSTDFIQSLLDSYDSVMIDAYLKGLFVNMSSHRFYYSYDPKKNLDKTIQQIPGATVCISMDFNVDPMTATLWHIIPVLNEHSRPVRDVNGVELRRALAFDQIELGGPKGADTNEMCQAIISRGHDPSQVVVYPDPAGRARSTSGLPDIQILKQHGFTQIKYRNVAPQFRKRQLAVCNMLDKGLIQINPETCKGLKKDLESVEHDNVTCGKIKSNPKLTHFSDGMDYFIDIEFPLSGSKPKTQQPRIR